MDLEKFNSMSAEEQAEALGKVQEDKKGGEEDDINKIVKEAVDKKVGSVADRFKNHEAEKAVKKEKDAVNTFLEKEENMDHLVAGIEKEDKKEFHARLEKGEVKLSEIKMLVRFGKLADSQTVETKQATKEEVEIKTEEDGVKGTINLNKGEKKAVDSTKETGTTHESFNKFYTENNQVLESMSHPKHYETSLKLQEMAEELRKKGEKEGEPSFPTPFNKNLVMLTANKQDRALLRSNSAYPTWGGTKQA